jgi:methyl-accepting chemotaxis protein
LLVRGELEQMQMRLNQLPKNLASRFAESEEAIKAIDSARRQLVSSVTQLQSRINQMQLSIEQSKSAPVKP